MNLLILLALACSDPADTASTDTETAASDTEASASDTETTGGCTTVTYPLEEGGDFFTADGASAFAYFVDDPEAPERDCRPLLVFLHGGSSPGGMRDGEWQDFLGTNFIEAARTQNIVLMVPFLEDAANVTHTWSEDDGTALDAMIEQVGEHVGIDTDHILVVGQSAGGFMSGYYGTHHATAMTHMATVSAGYSEERWSYPDTAPEVLQPWLVAHDPEDPVVPVAYSEAMVDLLDDHGHIVEAQLDWDLDGHAWNPGLTDALLLWWLE